VNSRAEDLRVGGLTAMTTVDYPGELSAVVFCQGCPWRCRYCHNGHLLTATRDGLLPWSQLIAFLERRRGLLDAVVFSGGEPTLQSALPQAVEEVASLGFKIGLHTAGPYPGRLRPLLPHLDWVGLDIKALPEDYPRITGVAGSGEKAWDSLRLLRSAGIALQVRTTLMPGWAKEDRVQALTRRLKAAGVEDCVLQPCRTRSTLTPP
jgi:pyruvate formate lyase activating enzyme